MGQLQAGHLLNQQAQTVEPQLPIQSTKETAATQKLGSCESPNKQ